MRFEVNDEKKRYGIWREDGMQLSGSKPEQPWIRGRVFTKTPQVWCGGRVDEKSLTTAKLCMQSSKRCAMDFEGNSQVSRAKERGEGFEMFA